MIAAHSKALICGRHRLSLDRPLVMGVLNVTPDSFADGGRYADRCVTRPIAFGRCSTRAPTSSISAANRPGPARRRPRNSEELERVIPLLENIRLSCDARGVPISVDTRKPAVMRAAIAAGASMINDINALRADRRDGRRRRRRRRGLPDAHAGRAG